MQSLWPVPEHAIRDAFAGITRIVVAELNHGQYRREIERLASGIEVVGLHRVDGELIAPESFLDGRTLREEGVDAAARDFLAGMTDRYAVALYEHLFIPKPWVGPWPVSERSPAGR